MPEIILASASPRRAELLQQIGLPFRVYPSDLDEEQFSQPVAPSELVMKLALQKAQKVAQTVADGLVIGADTVVVIAGDILGKPATPAEAISMLTKLNGKVHSVFTGLALVEVPSDRTIVAFEETGVKFRSLSKSDIESYVATGEPLDKAGGYGIQGKGAILVEKITGCYFNVVGLPIAKLVNLLKEFGVSIW